MHPDASGCAPDVSRCVGMRRDFEFQQNSALVTYEQNSANSGKIPANIGQNCPANLNLLSCKIDKNSVCAEETEQIKFGFFFVSEIHAMLLLYCSGGEYV